MALSEGFLLTDDDLHLYYQRVGSGEPTLVVPNGLVYVADFERLTKHRTVIYYDVRNRGRSDTVTDPAKLARGIHHDVDDLDAVRRHFGLKRMSLLGHSYQGLMVVLFAMTRGQHLDRVVQIGAPPPVSGTVYPPELTGADATFAAVMKALAEFQKSPPAGDPVERCRAFWSILRPIFVVNPKDATRVDWGRCELPNERNAFAYLNQHIFPSLKALSLTSDVLASVTTPVLILHGRKDRSAPYGGGRDWASRLPNARLLTVDNAAHMPWIEAPDQVFKAIETFLSGTWPEAAVGV
jgi:pimeloyl-ACP methyl ester carboxylesterase